MHEGEALVVLNGDCVSWSSHRQKCIATSTTEAEYVACSLLTKDLIWLRRLLKNLGEEQRRPTIIYCDNQSAVRLVKSKEMLRRTRHIEYLPSIFYVFHATLDFNINYVSTFTTIIFNVSTLRIVHSAYPKQSGIQNFIYHRKWYLLFNYSIDGTFELQTVVILRSLIFRFK